MMAPAARSFPTTVESRGGCEPSSASDPAVHDILSAVSRLSLTRMGIPWSGPRSPFSFRSLSSASAISSASGLISRMARRVGPLRSISSIRERYASVSCREVKRPATSPSSMIRMVISSNGNGLEAGFACPGSVPCGKGRVPCARLPSAEDAAAARPAPRTPLRDHAMQNLLLIGGRLRPPRTPGGPRRGRRDPVWLDLPRRECLRKVLSHQLPELVAVEEIDGSAPRRVSRVGGEATEGHVDPLPHELRSRRVDEVPHLVPVDRLGPAEDAVDVDPPSPDRRRVVREQVHGRPSPLAALRRETHLGEEHDEKALEALDPVSSHPGRIREIAAEEVLRRGRRDRLVPPDEEDEAEPDQGGDRRDDQDAHRATVRRHAPVSSALLDNGARR